MNRTFVSLGAALAFLGVALGAFGTHALRARVTPKDLETWNTAVQYHTIHAVALVLIGLICAQTEAPLVRRAGWLHVAGIAIFGGTLYCLVLTGQRWLGAVTPLGGLCFLIGWLCLALGARK
jgi:uncharacterized membrane protein YgdD (TMEM256/DUF423 family)